MRHRSLRAVLGVSLLLLAHCGDETTSSEQPITAGAAGSGGYLAVPPDELIAAPKSCAYRCQADCSEHKLGYVCPAVSPWAALPHMESCPAWDGAYPAVKPGQCVATPPEGIALARPSKTATAGQPALLPDGRTPPPPGQEWTFAEAGSAPSHVIALPGTSLLVVLDTGRTHAIRLLDRDKLGSGDPVLVHLPLAGSEQMNGALAFVPPGRVYAATTYSTIQAFQVDAEARTLTRDDAASLRLPDGGKDPIFTSTVAASPDGKRLVAAPVLTDRTFVFDIDPASPTYKQLLGDVVTGSEAFAVAFDPADGPGAHAYISQWAGSKVLDLDLTDPTKPVVARSYPTGQNPQGIAFLDARWMVVANDYGETFSLIDRVSHEVTEIPVEFEPGLRGLDLSGVVWDAPRSRLWAILAGLNAVAAYDVDLTAFPPLFKPVGKLQTTWWPSSLVAHDDGSLTVSSLRGRGIGPYLEVFATGDGNGDRETRGSIHRLAAPSAADLADGEKVVRDSVSVGSRPGYPRIDCPAGASDFPIPASNTEGPSARIKRVFFIVRENKTFDSLQADLPGVDGDAKFLFKDTSEGMEQVWPNFRNIARTFATSDNCYNLALESSMGHQWTTYGRDSDFCERTFGSDGRPVPLCGVASPGVPAEGSLFDWLQRNKVGFSLLGEIVGNPTKAPPGSIDARYPGGPFQNISYPDNEKACYAAARLRIACDINPFVYMTLPNDHTVGVNPKNPSPETMCAVNDEATGMFVDALSHSPFWAESLVIITEDDPQQGGDHVDYHRVPIAFASPWIKRGHVSKTLMDMTSLHKLFAHIYGLPYPNATVKNAGLPLDLFTSTPDYTPYTYAPRRWPLECGKDATRAESELTDSWDFSEIDAQPGLGPQVSRWMRRQQLDELTPELRAAVVERHRRRALRLPPVRDDDDD